MYQLNETKIPLIQRLKEWINPITLRQTVHDWYHSMTTNELYHISKPRIEKFFGIESGRLLLINLDSKEIFLILPDDTIPIILEKDGFNIHPEFTYKKMQIKITNFRNSIK